MITKFEAGGLIQDDKFLAEGLSLSAPSAFTVPKYVDSRPYCLPSSNQGAFPHCSGYATAGYIEVMKWKQFHIAEQVDGDAIYAEAKKLDGSPSTDGTSLNAAVEGAQKLGLISSDLKLKTISSRRDMKFALHKYGVCIGGANITKGWNSTSTKNGYIGAEEPFIGGHATLL